MATRDKQTETRNWLGERKGKFTKGELISVTLAFLGIVLIFCLFFIRRKSVDYHLEHTFAISAPEFFPSALALTDPVPITGNRIELLQNGDEFFPAMLEAIRGARKTINFASYIMKSDAVGTSISRCALRPRRGREWRCACFLMGSGPVGRSIIPTCA